MSERQLERLIYYTGQLLTSRDFEDQQEYHIDKLQQFIQRFPYGVVKGLNVICDLPKEPPNDFEAFKITEGFAVDESGNAIVVASEGLRIPVDEFYQEAKDKDQLFLSVRYTEKKKYSPASSHDSSTKNNRITESVEHRWDEGANRSIKGLVSHITLAKIRRRKDNENIDNKKTCHNDELIIEEEIENQIIRLDAGIIEEEQLSNELKGKLVTGGDGHNHVDGHGALIPESGLDGVVKGKLVTGGDDHDHTGGGGAQVPMAGLAPEVTAQLVTQGGNHNHTAGHGAPIPESGLTTAVQAKLVDDGNTHDHTGGGGARVPVAGLAPEVTAQLVTQGDSHDHTAGHGALIPESGLTTAVQTKLVDGGNTHDHTGPRAVWIPEGGLHSAVRNKLVDDGNRHDHTGGHGALIPEAGLDLAVQTKLVNGGNAHNHSGPGGNQVALTGLAADVTEKLVTLLPVTLDSGDTTLDAGTHTTAIINAVEQNAIIHIVPTQGVISWTYTVEPNRSFLKYTMIVANPGPTEAKYEVRKFVFGAG